jgi:hypothetical protein
LRESAFAVAIGGKADMVCFTGVLARGDAEIYPSDLWRKR